MIRLNNIYALFLKQFKDTLKNVSVIILFVVYPVITAVMGGALADPAGTVGGIHFFIGLFGCMHAIFAPLIATASMISEEKEKNTLRVLIQSGVGPVEYLLSVGGFVFLCDMLFSVSFLVLGDYRGREAAVVVLYLALGCIGSILLGMAIGGYARNAMAANAVSIPFGMVFSFLPMLAAFNEPVARAAKYTYGQQIALYIRNPSGVWMSGETALILLANFAVFLILFVWVFRRNRLD